MNKAKLNKLAELAELLAPFDDDSDNLTSEEQQLKDKLEAEYEQALRSK